MSKRICIIGAGTVGLSMALKILEEVKDTDAVEITIVAEAFTNQTTSYGSGGLWEPYQIVGTPDDLINKWGEYSFQHFMKLHMSPYASQAGIQLMQAYSLFTAEESTTLELPSWKSIALDFKVLGNKELRQMMLPDRFATAFSFTTLVVTQKYYMNFLTKTLESRGVRFEQRKVESLVDLYESGYDAIINCAGLGSHGLIDDKDMYPIRGQVVRVKAEWMNSIWFWGPDDRKSYIIPNVDSVVLGGTAEKGNWDTTPSIQETERILSDICQVFPAFRDAPIESVWVGLRPGRTPVRLECEKVPISNGTHSHRHLQLVFHCYGHGGSGITLAMGCAHDLVTNLLIPELFPEQLVVVSNHSIRSKL